MNTQLADDILAWKILKEVHNAEILSKEIDTDNKVVYNYIININETQGETNDNQINNTGRTTRVWEPIHAERQGHGRETSVLHSRG